MKIDEALDLISTLSRLIPVPIVSALVPSIVTLAKDLEHSGLFDGSKPIELDTLGDAHRAALADLTAELQKARSAHHPA